VYRWPVGLERAATGNSFNVGENASGGKAHHFQQEDRRALRDKDGKGTLTSLNLLTLSVQPWSRHLRWKCRAVARLLTGKPNSYKGRIRRRAVAAVLD